MKNRGRGQLKSMVAQMGTKRARNQLEDDGATPGVRSGRNNDSKPIYVVAGHSEAVLADVSDNFWQPECRDPIFWHHG